VAVSLDLTVEPTVKAYGDADERLEVMSSR
jgi:hypothetical protein